jgi:hypothetical protein
MGNVLARSASDECLLSVVVSIQMRKLFAEVGEMFSDARHAEQNVRERRASQNF